MPLSQIQSPEKFIPEAKLAIEMVNTLQNDLQEGDKINTLLKKDTQLLSATKNKSKSVYIRKQTTKFGLSITKKSELDSHF